MPSFSPSSGPEAETCSAPRAAAQSALRGQDRNIFHPHLGVPTEYLNLADHLNTYLTQIPVPGFIQKVFAAIPVGKDLSYVVPAFDCMLIDTVLPLEPAPPKREALEHTRDYRRRGLKHSSGCGAMLLL